MINSLRRQRKILVVEDEPLVARIICKMLEEIGYASDAVTCGEEAVAMCANGYDMVIMDIGLPGINGIDATIQIRQDSHVKKSLSIVAMTGYNRDEVEDQCLVAGMNEVLTKPVSIEQLKEVVKHYCH